MNDKRKNEEDNHGSKRGRKSDDEKPLEPSDDKSRADKSWADLPSLAVEMIYSHLNREDQCRMSMVCRNWNREIASPSLWREFEFLVPEQHLNLEVYPEVLLARKYGHMFRHVEIVWNEAVRSNHIELIWEQVKLFLEALASHSTLETVALLHMKSPYVHELSGDVHQTIKNFFLSQHQLKTVEIINTYFYESAEADILRTIFLNNSKSLQNVTVVNDEHGFDPDAFDDYEITENVGNEAIFESFLNMKTLCLNYHHFFGNIMIAFHEYIQNADSRRTKGNLEFIEIVVCYEGFDHDRFRKIPPEFWKLLTKICPSLRLNLTLHMLEYGDDIRDVIDLFVGPTMPLKELIIELDSDVTVYDDDDSAETRIGVFLRHLQSRVSKEYLEDLTIVWPRRSSLTIDLTGLLQTFQKLRNLVISTEEGEFENPNTLITHFATERDVWVFCSVRVHLIINGETRN